MKRILSFDLLRALAIIGVLFVHRMHYSWKLMEQPKEMFNNSSGSDTLLIIITIIMFTMAGLFYFITGAVNTYSFYVRITNKKQQVNNVLLGFLASGVVLLIIDFLYKIFFADGFEVACDRNLTAGYLTSFIKYGEFIPLHTRRFLEPNTLSLIAWIIIISSLLNALVTLLNRSKIIKVDHQRFLISLAVLILFLSPLASYYCQPLYESYSTDGMYLKAFILAQLTVHFGLFPYLGYGLYGAAVGTMFAQKISERKIKRFITQNSLFWLVFSSAIIISLVLLKLPLIGILKYVMHSAIAWFELGLFLIVTGFIINVVDFSKNRESFSTKSWFIWLQRFGIVALTVYIMEPLLASFLGIIVNSIFGETWNINTAKVLMMAFLCIICWGLLLKLWSRYNYKYSFEWFSSKLLYNLTGKISGKINNKL